MGEHTVVCYSRSVHLDGTLLADPFDRTSERPFGNWGMCLSTSRSVKAGQGRSRPVKANLRIPLTGCLADHTPFGGLNYSASTTRPQQALFSCAFWTKGADRPTVLNTNMEPPLGVCCSRGSATHFESKGCPKGPNGNGQQAYAGYLSKKENTFFQPPPSCCVDITRTLD